MSLSYSAIRTYLECPFRYRLTYIERLPTRTRPYMKLANALHYTLELFHRNLSREGSLEGLFSLFESQWSYPSGKFDRRQYEEGKGILERYYLSHRGDFPSSVLLEERFKFGIGPYGLSGKLDRVDPVWGGYEIIDYKTPRDIPEKIDTLQLDIYQLGFYSLTRKVAQRLSFYYLRQGEKRTVEKGGENIQRTQEFLSQVAWQMGSDESLEPKAGKHCRACDFTPYCPDRTQEPVPLPNGGRPRQLTLFKGAPGRPETKSWSARSCSGISGRP